MNVTGTHYRSIWFDARSDAVCIIDQRWLPHEFRVVSLADRQAVAIAIRDMWVRGAPLIGATAAYGMALQMRKDPSNRSLDETWQILHATRPTAINLRWSLERMQAALSPLAERLRGDAAFALAASICAEDIDINRRIGIHGLAIIRQIHQASIKRGKPADEPVRILTHCNAGWLATVDRGTATSPIYEAAEAGLPLHVWVDETRPRNQGALTAWELLEQGIPHAYITDNAGGHLMQHDQVDLVIVGTDRTTAGGDVCNKIGTYLKALAAHANQIPFYVALPSPTIDWSIHDGIAQIPIETRTEEEISHVQGRNHNGELESVQVTPVGSAVVNPAFDVTPAELVTGLITERGVCRADAASLATMFPDRR